MKQRFIDIFQCDENATIVDAMELIDSNRSGTLFIINAEKTLVGAVTDGDIRRWILKAGDLKEPVSNIMNISPKYLFEGQESQAESLMRANFVRVIPILDSTMRIVDVINSEDKVVDIDSSSSYSLADIPVVIMAGGEGTRLYPYTKILPKPLIPIGDTPIVERIINQFTEYRISKFFMTVNYKKGMIKTYFGDLKKDYVIKYVDEDIPLGTAGSIKLIKEQLDCPLFVTNCDTLIMTDYKALYKHHIEAQNDITVVTALKKMIIPYGVIHTGVDGCIDHLDEKPKLSYFVNTGMYVINPEIITIIPKDTMFHMTDLIEKVIGNGGRVGAFPISEDSFLDMGEFGELKRMEEKLNIVSD